MKISFIIPAYNEEALIEKCLKAVLRETAQAPCDTEIILVNNASTDKTREVAQTFHGVRVIDERRKGITRARQTGYEASSGDLIANIDADTMLPPGWIATVVHEFTRDPNLVALSGPQIYYDLNEFERSLVRVYYASTYLLHLTITAFRKGAMLQGGNFIVRRSALATIGGFDTSIEFYGEDSDIARRVAKIGKVKWTFALPIYASGRRLREEGIIRTGWNYGLNHFSVLSVHKPYTKTHQDIRV
ncbi:MAG TPA: glycosyltransferase family 2 protein [Candidatus Paceibacterota bacterium]|nr:glycosyltransferase family 2 protein [Candidatus Paceibacterota bacterium]